MHDRQIARYARPFSIPIICCKLVQAYKLYASGELVVIKTDFIRMPAQVCVLAGPARSGKTVALLDRCRRTACRAG